MQTEAIFDNIAERILLEIGKANHSIFIAVAWFTNKSIFKELLDKSKQGVNISLLISNDAINQNSAIDFILLNTENAKVYMVGNGNDELMHNKFCIIDYSTVITGSYNWSYKAESNFENIIITYDDSSLANQFIKEFASIKSKYYPELVNNEVALPLNKIIKRLEILNNYILLEDREELNREVVKLKEYEFQSDLKRIVISINNQEFAEAIKTIEVFINKHKQLSIWNDPEVDALKLEIKTLENKLNAFDNEKIELEKVLLNFQHQHTLILGDTILEILKLKKLKHKLNKEKFEEYENDEKQYKESIADEKNKKVFDITEEEKLELKKNFRKASVLCHPDKVSDEHKDAAQSIFIELKAAYDANDINRVSEIVKDLEQGNYFKARSETIKEKDLLKAAIAKLKMQISVLETEIIEIKESNSFKQITTIEDWKEYFINTKELLEQELSALQKEIIIIG
jgi:hypothetical protein